MSSRGLSAPGPKKSKTESKKSQSILTLFRLHFRLFVPPGREDPGTHFRTLFPTLRQKGPNDTCSRQKFLQSYRWSFPSSNFSGGPGTGTRISLRCMLVCFDVQRFSRERLYKPSPPPFLAKRHFSGEGGGGVYFEAPRGRNFIRPPFYTPPTPRRVFSGMGGWGCIKFGPVVFP